MKNDEAKAKYTFFHVGRSMSSILHQKEFFSPVNGSAYRTDAAMFYARKTYKLSTN
jgi:hypothetical protein